MTRVKGVANSTSLYIPIIFHSLQVDTFYKIRILQYYPC